MTRRPSSALSHFPGSRWLLVVPTLASLLLLAACDRNADDLTRTRDRLASLEAANEALEARLEAALKAATVAGEELAHARLDTQANHRRVATLQARLRALSSEGEQLRGQLSGSSSQSAWAQGAAATASREVMELRQTNEALSRQLAAVNGLLGQQRAQGSTLR